MTEAKRYRAIDNKFMFREARVIEGQIWRDKVGWVDVPAGGIDVPKDACVKSGSIFEIAAPKSREKAWFRDGTVAPIDQVLHFNLDDLFEPEAESVLNLHGIFTLEDIATELDAVLPGSEIKNAARQIETIPMRTLLGKIAEHVRDADGQPLTDPNHQVDEWIAEARRIVGPSAVQQLLAKPSTVAAVANANARKAHSAPAPAPGADEPRSAPETNGSR